MEESQMEGSRVWTMVGRGGRDRITELNYFWMAGVIGWVSQDGGEMMAEMSKGESERGVHL